MTTPLTVLNQQPIEKVDYSDDGSLEVIHIFQTIQGEGPFAGRKAAFIRLVGCNLCCPHCDSDYTSRRERISVLDVCQMVYELNPGGLVVITGGEPFRQNISPLAFALLANGHKVQVETNGTLAPETEFPFGDINLSIVISPKTPVVNQKLAARVHAYKYVLQEGHVDDDGLPSQVLGNTNQQSVARPPRGFPTHRIYVQPMDEVDDEKNAVNLERCKLVVLEHNYTLSMQIHKYLNME